MSRRGATHRGKYNPTFERKIRSKKGQRNRRMDDFVASQLEVGGMSYEELQHHVEKCRSKVAHKTRGAAHQAKISAEERFGTEFKVYSCPICGHFHITSHPWFNGDE